MDLKNSTILITVGTSGIGLELVKQLTARGAEIIVTGRNQRVLEETKRKFPEVNIFQSDVSKPENIDSLYAAVTGRFPKLNIIINNAGEMRLIDLQDSSMDLFDINREITTNLSGTIRMAHRFLPHLLKQPAEAT